MSDKIKDYLKGKEFEGKTEDTDLKDTDSDVPKQTIDPVTYTWEQRAKELSDKIYQQSAAEAEAGYSTKASELRSIAAQGQENFEMQKYANAQTADKLGWTGGYIFDQQKQLAFLQEGIKASLYNEQELQKLGFKSQLAAARLAADVQNTQLAYQYYQDAQQQALNQAQITGFYLPAEALDLLTQANAAQTLMELHEEGTPEYERAKKTYDYAEKYFSSNGISKQGMKTLSMLQYLSEEEREKWDREFGIIQAAKDDDAYKNGSAVLVYGEDGKVLMKNDYEAQLIYFTNVNPEELNQILNIKVDGEYVNQHVLKQYAEFKLNQIITYYAGYIEETKQKISRENFNNWLNSNHALKEEYQNAMKAIDFENKDDILDKAYATMYDSKGGVSLRIDGNLDVIGSSSLTKEEQDELEKAKERRDDLKKKGTLTDAEKEELEGLERRIEELEPPVTPTTNITKVISLKDDKLSVNTSGDTFANNNGNRGYGLNCSLLLNGEKLRVQTGYQVKLDSDLDKALEQLVKDNGKVPSANTLVIYNGVLYVRDTKVWYVVEQRSGSKADHWQDLALALGIDYGLGVGADDPNYTIDRQLYDERKQGGQK